MFNFTNKTTLILEVALIVLGLYAKYLNSKNSDLQIELNNSYANFDKAVKSYEENINILEKLNKAKENTKTKLLEVQKSHTILNESIKQRGELVNENSNNDDFITIDF